MRKCPGCKFTKPVSEWPAKATGGKCTECRSRDKKLYRQQMRDAVLRSLGYSCVCCGESEKVFLDIDHIFNDGAQQRRETSAATWTMALRQPDRFQILCRNCNWAKHMGGCPHQRV